LKVTHTVGPGYRNRSIGDDEIGQGHRIHAAVGTTHRSPSGSF
jgi:hypothetical protein